MLDEKKRDKLLKAAAADANRASREAQTLRSDAAAARLVLLPRVLVPLVLLAAYIAAFFGTLTANLLTR